MGVRRSKAIKKMLGIDGFEDLGRVKDIEKRDDKYAEIVVIGGERYLFMHDAELIDHAENAKEFRLRQTKQMIDIAKGDHIGG